jgi:lipopolysaccharide export system permease protein
MVRKQALGPIPALWVPCAIFTACSLWLFWVADRKPGQDPLAHLFDGLSSIGAWFRRLLPRRITKAAE